MADRISRPCPADGCQGTVKVPDDLPAGVYQCPCHTVWLHLTWATMADYRRVPMLSVADAPTTEGVTDGQA